MAGTGAKAAGPQTQLGTAKETVGGSRNSNSRWAPEGVGRVGEGERASDREEARMKSRRAVSKASHSEASHAAVTTGALATSGPAGNGQRGRVRRHDSASQLLREQQRARVSRRQRKTSADGAPTGSERRGSQLSVRNQAVGYACARQLCAAGARQDEMKIVRNAYAPKKLKDTGVRGGSRWNPNNTTQ